MKGLKVVIRECITVFVCFFFIAAVPSAGKVAMGAAFGEGLRVAAAVSGPVPLDPVVAQLAQALSELSQPQVCVGGCAYSNEVNC